MTFTTEELAKRAEVKSAFNHLLGETILDGWTFIGADVIRVEEPAANYYKHPNLRLNIVLSHDHYTGAGELDELTAAASPVMNAIIHGYSLEEAQENSAEIEEELEEGILNDEVTPLFDLTDMPYTFNNGRYDY